MKKPKLTLEEAVLYLGQPFQRRDYHTSKKILDAWWIFLLAPIVWATDPNGHAFRTPWYTHLWYARTLRRTARESIHDHREVIRTNLYMRIAEFQRLEVQHRAGGYRDTSRAVLELAERELKRLWDLFQKRCDGGRWIQEHCSGCRLPLTSINELFEKLDPLLETAGAKLETIPFHRANPWHIVNGEKDVRMGWAPYSPH